MSEYQDISMKLLEISVEHGRDATRDMFSRLRELPCAKPACSPIETLMGSALYFLAFNESPQGLRGLMSDTQFLDEANIPLEKMSAPRVGFDGFHIGYQVGVGNYTADFIVNGKWNGCAVSAAIECDGHEFHERTKRQATHDKLRDRYFQTRGLLVLRYTGSEIWAAPVMKARDALTVMRTNALARSVG